MEHIFYLEAEASNLEFPSINGTYIAASQLFSKYRKNSFSLKQPNEFLKSYKIK